MFEGMNLEDVIEATALFELFQEAESYPSHLAQASIDVDNGKGLGFVKWDKNINAFKVLYYACVNGGPSSIDDLIGHNAVIQNEQVIAKGIIQQCNTQADEVWFIIEGGSENTEGLQNSTEPKQ